MNVSRYMTQKLITVGPEASVQEAFHLMRGHQVRHIPVVDKGELVGIISDRDLRRPQWADRVDDWTAYYWLDEGHRVADVMTLNPDTVRASDDILKAVRLFRERRYGALPVLNKNGDLVGILSAQDLLQALEELITEPKTRRP